ncbi:MAG: glutamyl-tRNA reductase, partial [Armatimonadota bacterium]|nr:glutamyl-tRNA reductase [Armatimonadota bacterium]
KAEHLALAFNGKAVKFDNLLPAIIEADIIITSTGAPEPIISRNLVISAMHVRRGRPIFFIDIAVPRDVEQTVGLLDNVFAYDIDDLQKVLEDGETARRAEISKVEALIDEQVSEFMRWFRTRDVVPIIAELREKYEEICDSEVKKLRRKLQHLSDEEWNAIVATARSIVRKVIHQPLTCIKQYAEFENSSEKLDFVRELFGLQIEESEAKEDEAGGS